MKTSFCVIFVAVFSFSAYSINWKVQSNESFLSAIENASRGDTIYWLNGIYSDIKLEIIKNGLIIHAEKPGKVIFTGNSFIKLNADSVVISGFQFKDGQIKDDIIEVAGSYNTLENINFSNYHSKYYLNVLPSGRHNLISKCNFERKPEDITSSVVEIQVSEDHPGYNIIRFCSFKNHTAPPGAGGDYGIEALRIGYSFQSKFISRTLVEYCYFTKCNGDGEIISSKARENVYRYNTFENNGASHFTLRHGSDNVIYSNFFLGGAGLRIKEGQNQMIYNNYFETGDQFAIWLVNHKADPLENIVIAHNTFINSGGIKFGGIGNYPPQKVIFAYNLFQFPRESFLTDVTRNELFFNNAIEDIAKFINYKGFVSLSSFLVKNEFGYFQPGIEQCDNFVSQRKINLNIIDIPDINDDPDINFDIMNQNRFKKKNYNCYGCSILNGNKNVSPYANQNNTGPLYLINHE